uniref:NADH dehydrogenase [ubiquinone] 1 alpha subcomplex subunit 13-like n=1 Tax=Styela clava TaxID=7725 RepID=UPI0019397E64|nr:NADH dehydrogenase [ubiquinone] 1 alpha subcomplex subunit 13-like [Styela clava]
MAGSGEGSKAWSKIRYKQDMPPPGGYGRIPYLRNLPVRGPSSYGIFGFAIFTFGYGFHIIRKNMKLDEFEKRETRLIEMTYLPLLEAEKDRNHLREYKEIMEAEALNIIGTGSDPDHVVGQHEWESKRWRAPYHQYPEVIYSWTRAIDLWYHQYFRKDVPGP